MRPINRIMPKLPVQAMTTYQVSMPMATHFRPATCQEVHCPHHEMGWRTVVDEDSDLGRKQAHYIRRLSERHFTEETTEVGLTAFTFPAGQRCFRQHNLPLDREEFFSKFQGDWRGQVGRLIRLRPDDWLYDFADHQDQLAREIERG